MTRRPRGGVRELLHLGLGDIADLGPERVTQIGAVQARQPVDEPTAVDVDDVAAFAADEHRDLGVPEVVHVREVQDHVVAHLLLHCGSIDGASRPRHDYPFLEPCRTLARKICSGLIIG